LTGLNIAVFLDAYVSQLSLLLAPSQQRPAAASSNQHQRENVMQQNRVRQEIADTMKKEYTLKRCTTYRLLG